jgi:glycosyltransferase involved in cell wall biosynthesis
MISQTHSSTKDSTRSSSLSLNEPAGDMHGMPAFRAQTQTTPSTGRPVLFVTYHFPPNGEIGARTCAQIARYLPSYGWKPTILTIEKELIEKRYLEKNDVLTAWGLNDSVIRTKTWFHPLDLYRFGKRLISSSSIEENGGRSGAGSKHSELLSQSGGGVRELVLSLLSFPDAHTAWIPPSIISGWRAIRRTKAQAIFSSAPCWTNHIVGYCLSRLTGLPWIAHFRDPCATGSLGIDFNSDVELRLANLLEQRIVRQAARIICVTEEHCEVMRSAYRQYPADKFAAIPNGFDGADWEEFDRQRAQRSGEAARRNNKFRITYAGTLYIKRNPTPVFRALQTLIDAGEIPRERVQVDLIGWCEVSEGRSVADVIAEMGLNDVARIVGPLSHKETLQSLAKSDLLLLLAEELTLQIPGKTFEYLKAGRPILALAPEGAVAKLLRQTGGGWAVASDDQEGVLAAVRECYQSWEKGEPERSPDPSIVARFDRRVTTGHIAGFLNSIQSKRGITSPSGK